MADDEGFVRLANFIGGEFVPPSTGEYMDNLNPATGKVYGAIPLSNADDVEAAVAAAKEGFAVWSAMAASERADIMRRIANAIEERIDEFAEAESRDQGKPVWLARAVDIPRAVANFRFFAGAIEHHEEMSTTKPGMVNYSLRVPCGVVGLISPWNLPIYLLTWKLGPSLCVGNAVVCKPSEFTSVTAYMLCQLCNDCGLPPGVINMTFGIGPDAGSPLVTHPDVPVISFTGGTATGEIIAKAAAPFQKKLSLELGGKNPNIVFADCDMDESTTVSVKSSFANQGEICLCGSRIFVQDTIFDDWLALFLEKVGNLMVGDPSDPETTTGALISQAHMEKVLYYINLAQEEGGKIEIGGNQPELEGDLAGGYFVNPTVITGLDPTCRTCQEEIFGPVVTVIPFSTEEEVIAYANGVKYGLACSIWTNDVKRAHRVAHAVEAGSVWVNCWLQRDLRVPFGGFKQSGIGREGGTHSIDFYTEQKNICIAI